MERKREKPELIGDIRLGNNITLALSSLLQTVRQQIPAGRALISAQGTQPWPGNPKHSVTVTSFAWGVTEPSPRKQKEDTELEF